MQMEMPMEMQRERAWAEPRRAAAAEPHKRLAVAALEALLELAREEPARPRATRRRGTAGTSSGVRRAARGGGSRRTR
eukprot:2887395-Prymnesium_polylepis.1